MAKKILLNKKMNNRQKFGKYFNIPKRLEKAGSSIENMEKDIDEGEGNEEEQRERMQKHSNKRIKHSTAKPSKKKIKNMQVKKIRRISEMQLKVEDLNKSAA